MPKARDIASELSPSRPPPQPHNPAEWLALGRALDREMRQRWGIDAHANTIAIGWTSVPGLRAHRFLGASQTVRVRAAVPSPTPHVVAPRSNAQFVDHAEQDVVNAFIDAMSGLPRPDRDLSGEFLRIYISHARGPCGACRQGLKSRQTFPGVIADLSRRYPGLSITLAWENRDLALEFMQVQDGERIG